MPLKYQHALAVPGERRGRGESTDPGTNDDDVPPFRIVRRLHGIPPTTSHTATDACALITINAALLAGTKRTHA
jgi:hypothetical protein